MSSEPKHIKLPDCIIEYLTNPLDKNLNEKLIEWLKTNENRTVFNQLNDIWQSSGLIDNDDIYNIKDAWEKIDLCIPLQNRRKFSGSSTSTKESLKSWLIAASIIVLAAIFGVIGYKYYQVSNRQLQYTEYTVPYGSRSNIVLPDGSEVWINAGSVLRYGSDFALTNRDVYLTGEAYFKVIQDKKLPFEVKLKTLTFKALGTSFNIKAYADEPIIEATVLEGKLQISGAGKSLINNRSNIYLNSNQKLIILNSESQKLKPLTTFDPINSGNQYKSITNPISKVNYKIVSNINPRICTSWKDEKWIIEQEHLDDFAVMLQRRYNVKIIFANEELKDYIFSGIIKNETLEQVLDAIYLTAPIEYEVNNDTITFLCSKRLPGVKAR